MGPLFGPKMKANSTRRDSKESSPNRKSKRNSVYVDANVDCLSTSSLLASSPKSPNRISISNHYFLVITILLSLFAVLLSTGALVFITQLQARVEILELQLSRYELVFSQLQSKDLPPPPLSPSDLRDHHHHHRDSLLFKPIVDTAAAGFNQSTVDLDEFLRHTSTANQQQQRFDQLIHEVSVFIVCLARQSSVIYHCRHLCPPTHSHTHFERRRGTMAYVNLAQFIKIADM